MREIKFRAYDGMDWVYSSAVEYRKEDDQWLIFVFELEEWMYCTEPEQYTGLKDRNDREIYEGDIVRYIFQGHFGKYYQEAELVNEVTFEFGAFFLGERLLSEIVFDDDESEIIGNIYEHPELLSEEETENE